jgi:hypothetical protein
LQDEACGFPVIEVIGGRAPAPPQQSNLPQIVGHCQVADVRRRLADVPEAAISLATMDQRLAGSQRRNVFGVG